MQTSRISMGRVQLDMWDMDMIVITGAIGSDAGAGVEENRVWGWLMPCIEGYDSITKGVVIHLHTLRRCWR